MVNGRSQFGGTTKYTLRSGGRQFVLMVPRSRESLREALRREDGTERTRSAATALLVALYEQQRIERLQPRLSQVRTAELLGISHDSLARAMATLGNLNLRKPELLENRMTYANRN
jgi:hypothetical protein